MAKKSRATFQKREKERARQQKQHAKVQRRLAAKELRVTNGPEMEDGELALAGMHLEPHALPESQDDVHPPVD